MPDEDDAGFLPPPSLPPPGPWDQAAIEAEARLSRPVRPDIHSIVGNPLAEFSINFFNHLIIGGMSRSEAMELTKKYIEEMMRR